MNHQHKIVRTMIRNLPKSAALRLLEDELPEREREAVYYADVLQKDLGWIGDNQLFRSVAMVKKYRMAAYKKLAQKYFDK